jgi:D-arabinose 1-dehydrogenase-like Zn-dependent alcohol dehydrogenase
MSCALCERGEEQYCADGFTLVFGAETKHGRAGPKARRTQGGFSSRMTVNEHFAAKIPKSIPLDKAAPIMCAGITMFDPLTHWKAGSERVKRVGIAGGGGLGQTGIRIAKVGCACAVGVCCVQGALVASVHRVRRHGCSKLCDTTCFRYTCLHLLIPIVCDRFV